jgi:hypothetical protein
MRTTARNPASPAGWARLYELLRTSVLAAAQERQRRLGGELLSQLL